MPWPVSNVLFCTRNALRIPTAYSSLRSTYTPGLQFSFILMSLLFSNLQTMLKCYHFAAVPCLSGNISECLWWELSNCAKITHHERHHGLCYSRNCHNGLVQRTLGLTCISPVKLLFVWRPKDGAHHITKGEKPDSRIPNPQFSRDLKWQSPSGPGDVG